MKRADWRSRLSGYIDAERSQGFSEARPCSAFVAGAVEAVTGVRPGEAYLGTKTIAGSMRRLKRDGYDGPVDLLATLFEEVHPSEAQPGDVAAIRTDDAVGWALGVVDGERTFVLREDGLGTVVTLTVDRVFRT